jgi:hypothetical protein
MCGFFFSSIFLCRPDVLEQFVVISAQFNSLYEELQRNLILQHFVVHPLQTTQEQQAQRSDNFFSNFLPDFFAPLSFFFFNFPSASTVLRVPDILRSKSIPEVEQLEQMLLQQIELHDTQSDETKIATLKVVLSDELQVHSH